MTDNCEGCIYNAQRKDMIKQEMIGMPYACMECLKGNSPIFVEPNKTNESEVKDEE